MLTSGLVIGCGQKQSSAELQAYVEEALPIMKRHTETTETTNQANRAFLEAYASGDLQKITEALTDYKNTLEWAVNRVDSTLLDFKKLIPPAEARAFHSLMIDGLTKEQAALGDTLAYYSSVLLYGFGDDKAIDNANTLMLEAQQIWLQAQYELQDLMQNLE